MAPLTGLEPARPCGQNSLCPLNAMEGFSVWKTSRLGRLTSPSIVLVCPCKPMHDYTSWRSLGQPNADGRGIPSSLLPFRLSHSICPVRFHKLKVVR